MAAFKLLRPKFEIDISATETPDWLSLQCATRDIKHDFDLETLDTATACAPTAKEQSITGEYIELTARWAFGTDEFFNTVSALYGGGPYDFKLTADGSASVSATNPVMTGTINVPPVKFIPGGGLNQFQDDTLRFDIVTGGSTSIAYT